MSEKIYIRNYLDNLKQVELIDRVDVVDNRGNRVPQLRVIEDGDKVRYYLAEQEIPQEMLTDAIVKELGDVGARMNRLNGAFSGELLSKSGYIWPVLVSAASLAIYHYFIR